MNARFDLHCFGAAKPVIGMLHAPPLPGAPRFDDRREAILERVLRDAEALLAGGVHGLLLENFGDAPFYPDRVPVAVVSHLTWLACEVRRRFDTPLGINVLRNDGRAALAVAAAAGARFIRVNVLSGACVTDQGIVQGCAHELMRDRAALQADAIGVLADVRVKHSSPLGQPRDIADEVADLVERAGADALVVTGPATGRPADPADLRRVKSAAGATPVLVGSGVAPENIAELAALADGFIVGTALKRGGRVENPVDPQLVRALLCRL